MTDQQQDHAAYLSFSERGWILIYQGSPLCDYKNTYSETMQVVAHYRIALPDVAWNGDRGEWVCTNTIEEIAA
jgi:hypothetical protein